MLRRIYIYFMLSLITFANTYELKKNELEILKLEKERYVRQKKINFSRFEKLKLEERVIQKELEISEFIQRKLEEKRKHEAKIDQLKQLLILAETKGDEIQKNYTNFKKNQNSISNFELLTLESSLAVNQAEIDKGNLELQYLNYLLETSEFNYITDELKEDNIINIKIKTLDSLMKIKKQEIKIIEMEKKGKSLLTLKKSELKNIELEKTVAIQNNEIKLSEIKSNLATLTKDKEIIQEKLNLMQKEITMLEQKFSLGAFSHKELFEKKIERYELLEEIIRIEGEIKLKEIELKQ